jgi:transcriptional regulator with XRE-family HTH domain
MSDTQLPKDAKLSFVDMFADVCNRHSNYVVAKAIGYSEQYVSDLRRGMRKPSVEVVEKVCEWMGRGRKGQLEWHQAGARAHGWRV